MAFETRLGRILIGAAFLAMGLESLLLHIYVGRLEPVPASWPGQVPGAYISGVLLVAIGAGILSGYRARLAAAGLALILLLWDVVLYLPKNLAAPGNVGGWNGTFETFALFGAAWLLAAGLPATGWSGLDRLAARGDPLGRYCFGVSLPVFAASHFVYHDFVASYVPAWIPARLFWAYATGAAHLAAGLAILSGILGRLAATLAALMYASWVLVLHIPRVMAAPSDPFEWNGVFVATAISGGAWLVAGSFAKSRS